MPGAEEPYDRTFFEGQVAASLQSARVVLDRVFPILQPRRVLDVGCGAGPWMRAALDLGATEVLGIDGDYVDRELLLVDPAAFIPADIAATALPEVLGARADTPFDLVMCMEVAEHLPFDRAPSLVAELTSLGDAVLFSAAVPFRPSRSHRSRRPPRTWWWKLRHRRPKRSRRPKLNRLTCRRKCTRSSGSKRCWARFIGGRSRPPPRG